MAHFRSKFQIFSLLPLNKNKYNPFLWQQPWHYAKSVCSKKNINEDCNRRSISTISKRLEYYGLKKKALFLNFRKSSSTKKLAAQKLTFWEYVFKSKKSLKNPSTCPLANREEQIHYKEDSCYRETSKDVLIYTNLDKSFKDSKRLVELQPKPPPSYKLPRAVLLSRAMVEGSIKKKDIHECKKITPVVSKKPYEEMKPASNTKRIIQHKENIRTEDVKSYEKSTSRRESIPINMKARDTAKILRQAMAQKEPQIHSRIEQLKMLINKEITRKSQCASQIDSSHKNSDE